MVKQSLDNFDQFISATVQQYADKADCALHNNPLLQNSHIHVCVYTVVKVKLKRSC
jgi:hypothetical protein